jgi:hypothetical protein
LGGKVITPIVQLCKLDVLGWRPAMHVTLTSWRWRTSNRLDSVGVMTTPKSHRDRPASPHYRALWGAIALLTGVVIGVIAGWLTWAGGVTVPLAVVAGGTAFGATVCLFIMLIKYVIDNG